MYDKSKKKRTKTYTEKEISNPALVKNRRTESVPNLPNNQYIENNTLYNQYNINSKHIQEIHIDLKNVPKGLYSKYNLEQKYSQNNSLTFRNKNTNDYSQESYNSPRINKTVANTPEYLAYMQNNSYSPSYIETYEVQFRRGRGNQNKSMDNTYYENKTYMNKNDNYNNSFLKNNGYYSQNNSFVMNNTNIEDESKLNNSNQDKDYYCKNTYTNIPKPKKFKKKIPPIPIRRSNDYNINNNSFYFDETNNANNNAILNKQNNRYYNIKNENDNKNNNYNAFHKKSKTEYKSNIYSNKTHSPRYIKNIEKYGIQISFSSKKRNESIDLISPEVFKDLKRHSSDRKNRINIISDLDLNKAKENKYNNINCNNLFNNKGGSYQKMRKKYIQKLSSFLLKNRKNKLAKSHSVRKEKYDIIDIKEKIKKERRNRSISNNSKLRKKETVKDNPAATSIRKEDDKGGKIDFIIPTKNIRNKTTFKTIRKDIKEKQCSSNFIINKSRITIKAAKTIQKWWRNILSKFLTELNIIKIQSVFRSYLIRKKMSHIMTEILLVKYRKRENIKKVIFIQKKWKEYYISLKNKKSISNSNKKFVYKKVHNPYQNKFGKNIHENNSKNNNNNYIQQNNSFGIISQKRKDSFDNKNDNENNIYNDLSKNGMFNDIKNNEIPSLIQTKNDIIEIKGIDDSHNDEDEDIYKCLKSDYNTERSNKNATDRTNPLIIGTNNLKLCFYTKKYYKNQEKNIIFIQKFFRYYLKCKKGNFWLDNKEDKIIKIPIMIFPCFVEKIRIRKNNTNTNKNYNIISKSFSHNFSVNNGDNINYSPKNNNSNNKYDENKIKMRREKQMLIIGNTENKDDNNSNFLNNNHSYNNRNRNIDSQSLQNINDINYVHDIEFSINKENKEGINQNPFIKKCYYSKKNIILIKKAPIDYSISKISSEKYPPTKKNILLEISPIKAFEFSGKQKNKAEYQISQNISDNYITPSLHKIENKDNNESINNNENINNKRNYLFTYSYYKSKNKPNKQNLYEISSNNIEIINSQSKLNDENLNDKDDKLNYDMNQTESIVKMPVQLRNYFTKDNIIIDNHCKNEFSSKIINLNFIKNNKCYISKIYKVDKTKYIILIQRLFRNKLIKRKMESNNAYMRQIVSNNLITKEIKLKDKLNKSEKNNNRVLNDLKNIKKSNSNLTDNNVNENDKDNENLINIKNILQRIKKDKDSDNNSNNNSNYNINNENNLDEKNIITGDKINDKLTNINNKKNIPYNKDIKIKGEMLNSNKNNLENLYKKEDNDNSNEITNDQNYIEGKSNKNSRNNENDEDPFMNKFKKNSQNYENIPTSYGTNDNLNFNKTKTSYNMIEKNDNLLENKSVINTQENNNSIDNKNDKKEYDQNKTNIYNKRYNDINNYIQTAYQINIFKEEDKIDVLKNNVNQYYMIDVLDKKKNIKNKNDVYILKMLIQRIKKNVNQYVFQLIKLYYFVDKNQKNKIDNNYNDLENKKNSNYEYEKENFFFNTIKRHLKINKIDNNLESNNEVVNLLKKCIPEYFDNESLKNYIPYINKKLENDLINTELFLFDDDKLADYIYKCYKIERNIFTITPQIIKARLIKNPLKYQNLFSITRYMDNLYKDVINGNMCQKCYCKKNELCLQGCSCHDNNYMIKNNLNSIIKNYNVINIIDLSNEKKQKKKFEILKRFSESKELSESDYRLSNNNERYSNNYNVNNELQKNNINNINIENLDKNNFEHERRGSDKIDNFIKDFSLRKKIRNSISSSTSNNNDEIGERKNTKYNLDSNLKEKSINELNIINYDDDDQTNVNEEEFNVEDNEGIKNINQSLFKKKISQIVPISSNRNNNIISKVNAFRKRQNDSRKKNKEVIKLRDDTNYDNEIYENI